MPGNSVLIFRHRIHSDAQKFHPCHNSPLLRLGGPRIPQYATILSIIIVAWHSDHLHFCADDKHRWNRNYAVPAQRGHPPLDDPILLQNLNLE